MKGHLTFLLGYLVLAIGILILITADGWIPVVIAIFLMAIGIRIETKGLDALMTPKDT